jgi:hypothetical protein
VHANQTRSLQTPDNGPGAAAQCVLKTPFPKNIQQNAQKQDLFLTAKVRIDWSKDSASDLPFESKV